MWGLGFRIKGVCWVQDSKLSSLNWMSMRGADGLSQVR